MKIKLLHAFTILVLFTGTGIHAQVTIGSGIPANTGALLDLKETNSTSNMTNSTKGLLLPRVLLEAPQILPPKSATYTEADIHIGLWVYNLTNTANYSMRNNLEDALCEGPYVWNGERWIRLLPDCPCQYTITGWADGVDYILSCTDYPNITQEQALNMCNNANNSRNTYHLMTYDEFQQIWSEPVKDITPDEYSFLEGTAYFVHKKSDITNPNGWVSAGMYYTDGTTKTGEVLALNKTIAHASPSSTHFPGGTPIGAMLPVGVVRCIKN